MLQVMFLFKTNFLLWNIHWKWSLLLSGWWIAVERTDGNPVWLCILHFTSERMWGRLYTFHYQCFSAGVSVLVNFEQSRSALFHFSIYSKCTTHTGIQPNFLICVKQLKKFGVRRTLKESLLHSRTDYIIAFHYVYCFQTNFRFWRSFILACAF